MEELLRVSDLTVQFDGRTILDDISFQIARGQSLAIRGASGAGTSTLIKCILGLIKPDSGLISLDGKPIMHGLTRAAAAARVSGIGVVFQEGHLLPELNSVENVAIAGMLGGMSWPEAEERASLLLRQLRVRPSKRSVTEYSGGEQQRIAIARALMNRPSLLVADEPTAWLDSATRDEVRDLLFSLPKALNMGLLVVTHDNQVAEAADSQLVLDMKSRR